MPQRDLPPRALTDQTSFEERHGLDSAADEFPSAIAEAEAERAASEASRVPEPPFDAPVVFAVIDGEEWVYVHRDANGPDVERAEATYWERQTPDLATVNRFQSAIRSAGEQLVEHPDAVYVLTRVDVAPATNAPAASAGAAALGNYESTGTGNASVTTAAADSSRLEDGTERLPPERIVVTIESPVDGSTVVGDRDVPIVVTWTGSVEATAVTIVTDPSPAIALDHGEAPRRWGLRAAHDGPWTSPVAFELPAGHFPVSGDYLVGATIRLGDGSYSVSESTHLTVTQSESLPVAALTPDPLPESAVDEGADESAAELTVPTGDVEDQGMAEHPTQRDHQLRALTQKAELATRERAEVRKQLVEEKVINTNLTFHADKVQAAAAADRERAAEAVAALDAYRNRPKMTEADLSTQPVLEAPSFEDDEPIMAYLVRSAIAYVLILIAAFAGPIPDDVQNAIVGLGTLGVIAYTALARKRAYAPTTTARLVDEAYIAGANGQSRPLIS